MESSDLLWAVLMEKFGGLNIENHLKIEIYLKAKVYLKSCLQKIKPNKEKLVVNGDADVYFLSIISDTFYKDNKVEIHKNIAIIDEYGEMRRKYMENKQENQAIHK
ncbi:MAG: hypothetical protein RR088_03520 [Clostridia bacterium]